MSSIADQNQLKSRPERTAYAETSRYGDVMAFIGRLQELSGAVRVESFATTNEGRALPLVILSRPAISSPAEAVRSGKPIVFIMANIHAGEVEGKEATQHLMRDVVSGPLAGLLDRLILLIAPIYNADGNERIDIRNRAGQNGPAGGVGTRENAQRLDLNRDFMKLETPEARGLIEGVFNRWDPHVVIDLHTTNGSYHGYALTYAPSLNPNTDRNLVAFTRDKLLPSVTKTLRSKHNYRAYFYGNFASERAPGGEVNPSPDADPKAWATFDHRPRFGNNYVGLRNRIAILSEAYSYLDFRSRVDVTDKFVRTILQFILDHAEELVSLTREADRYASANAITAGNEQGYGVTFELKQSPKPVEILVGSVTKIRDERTGLTRFEATDLARRVKMIEYGEFQPVRRVNPPAAYVVRPDQRKAVDLLISHGVTVESTMRPEELEVERYVVKQVSQAQRAFQGHKETRLAVAAEASRESFPEGSFLISMNQPKAALIFYLLEPESDDGLANWNYFDEALVGGAESKKAYPVCRLAKPVQVARQVVKR